MTCSTRASTQSSPAHTPPVGCPLRRLAAARHHTVSRAAPRCHHTGWRAAAHCRPHPCPGPPRPRQLPPRECTPRLCLLLAATPCPQPRHRQSQERSRQLRLLLAANRPSQPGVMPRIRLRAGECGSALTPRPPSWGHGERGCWGLPAAPPYWGMAALSASNGRGTGTCNQAAVLTPTHSHALSPRRPGHAGAIQVRKQEIKWNDWNRDLSVVCTQPSRLHRIYSSA